MIVGKVELSQIEVLGLHPVAMIVYVFCLLDLMSLHGCFFILSDVAP